VHVPAATKETVSPLLATLHVVEVFDRTDEVPSPVVETDAVKLRPNTAELGRLLTVGVVGVPCPIVKDCGVPSAAV
jgi:hypothetical protein